MNQYTGVNSNKEFVEVLANSFESALRLYRDLSGDIDPVQMYISKQNVRVAEDAVDPTFAVTVNDPAMGAVYPASGAVAVGSEIILTAVPAAGHQFVSWGIGGVNYTENPFNTVIVENTAITATFEVIP